ncbi:MAG: type II toxin-antitoxin system prevent-host-death family antitoxin [Chloroflexi bacterium]|nr:type II toxin-antitoxin system prevent-host-death family antitoxin [Chloroflexota bacterium]
MVRTSYTEAREHLAALLDRAVNDREVVVIERRGKQPVVLVAEEEWSSLQETAHLLSSPRNAERLLRSIEQARQGAGEVITVEKLREELGLSGD